MKGKGILREFLGNSWGMQNLVCLYATGGPIFGDRTLIVDHLINQNGRSKLSRQNGRLHGGLEGDSGMCTRLPAPDLCI
jgi:hypothetical protein